MKESGYDRLVAKCSFCKMISIKKGLHYSTDGEMLIKKDWTLFQLVQAFVKTVTPYSIGSLFLQVHSGIV